MATVQSAFCTYSHLIFPQILRVCVYVCELHLVGEETEG